MVFGIVFVRVCVCDVVQILPARVRAPARVSPTGDGGAAATLFVISLLELIQDCCPYYPIF